MVRFKDSIAESLRALKELEVEHSDTPKGPRVTMLRLMKEQPACTLRELGLILGRSERSLQRWWNAYRVQGMDGLLEIGRPGGKRPRRLDEQQIREIRQKIQHEGVGELGKIQEWLQRQYSVNYSRSGLRYMMRNAIGAQSRGWILFDDETKSGRNPQKSQSRSSTGLPAHVIRFLNALPTTGDTPQWCMGFRDALRDILGDVDRISINVNLECDLVNPGETAITTFVSQHITPDKGQDTSIQIVSRYGVGEHSERILNTMREQGFPFNLYQIPSAFDYYHRGLEYLGTIILWREIGRQPLSADTLELMAQIRPFIEFALSDLVVRHRFESPIDRVFYEAINAMADDAALTSQERRIVILQLMGHSYKEMANELAITLDTVKKHFKQIHRKTRTRGQAELFAKYFTSRLHLSIEDKE